MFLKDKSLDFYEWNFNYVMLSVRQQIKALLCNTANIKCVISVSVSASISESVSV